MRYLNSVKVDQLVFNLLKKFKTKLVGAKTVDKEPKDDIFDLVDASKLNDYLKQHMNDLSAKVFRTYNASITLQNQLANMPTKLQKKGVTVAEKDKFYTDCNREVAILCNHKKAESKNLKDQLERL